MWQMFLMKMAYRNGGREILKGETSKMIPLLKKIPILNSLYEVAEGATTNLTGEQELEGVALKVIDAYMGYTDG